MTKDGGAAHMWSAYYDANPARAWSTRLLGAFSRRAYYGPLAPFRARSIPSGALPGRRWVRVRNALAGVSDDDLNLKLGPVKTLD